jgi:hypothetical protein
MNNFKTKIDSPSDDYNHILDKHSDLGVTFGGYNVIFTSGGMPFAKQRFKMTTMADPLSGLKVIGQTMGKSLI